MVPGRRFDPALTRALEKSVHRLIPNAPLLPTGAGHDAGVLAAEVPSGMIYVRNPSGISHSPEEYVELSSIAPRLFLTTSLIMELSQTGTAKTE